MAKINTGIKLYTIKEAAKILKVSYPTMLNIIEEGKIKITILRRPKHKRGKRLIRISEKDLLEFLEKQKE